MGPLCNALAKHSSVIGRLFSKKPDRVAMKYLNVAEKNDAAKNIAAILSRGNSNRREGLSPYNKIYEFRADVFGENCEMVMTSVSGHLLNYEFPASHRNWQSCNPLVLFDAPVVKTCTGNYENIKKTLEREIRSCGGLIVWTDCDREGENIGFEIIKVCTDVRPGLRIYRAKFSEITGASVFRALATLGRPDKNVSDAVDVRQELDLRTGAAFTRLQTLRLQQAFPQKLAEKLISYGSCQFPTLGFVVERYQAIESFVPEQFWKIKMNHTRNDLTTEFTWKRERLFDERSCRAILDHCLENPRAVVESVDGRPKSKWRPLPLDTVEMEKNVSKKLRINAKETMRIAEKLYTQGFISYPRTETNIFPKELNLDNLVEQQRADPQWGPFAQRVIAEGGARPRQGKKSDQAHPPIHPTKYAGGLAGNEKKVYEYIVRHFLACVHKDAQGFETTVDVELAGEKFTAKGLIVLERNYLDVYVYEKWNAKEINEYRNGQTFEPSVLEMAGGSTTPPKLLTEADLIALMEKHGIGTDATHADHIDTIKSREYVGLRDIYFVPGNLGMGLVEGYNKIGLEVSLAKPTLRAEFENDLKLICEGAKGAETVRREQIAKYRAVFRTVAEKMRLIDDSLSERLDDRPVPVRAGPVDEPTTLPVVFPCPKCGNDMCLRNKKNAPGHFLGCAAYPGCKNALWLPSIVGKAELSGESCPECGPDYKTLKVTFVDNPFPGYPNSGVVCVGGCDPDVIEALGIDLSAVRRAAETRGLAPRPLPRHNAPEGADDVRIPAPRPLPRRNAPESADDVMCACNEKAIELTVRKDGPNKGKKFHKCASQTCNFFLWSAEGGTMGSATSPAARPAPPSGDEPRCNCGLAAVARTVQKEGPNRGRRFYCCSKPVNEQCQFFQWADEPRPAGGGGGDDGWGGGGEPGANWSFRGKARRGRGSSNATGRSQPYNAGSTAVRRPRKCGKCGQEGHTKNKCPR
ncbi:DNA topoisomerase 3-alpha [Cylas formicarius]|uniref:DNA topoisomerase 3-alpha n=1 Tax=Cylas formicarius TaxID=197179 RepID=UPI0029585CD5|nr:DNA topoisomerase 3-alpha [Cylas formicarius]